MAALGNLLKLGIVSAAIEKQLADKKTRYRFFANSFRSDKQVGVSNCTTQNRLFQKACNLFMTKN